MVSGMSEAIGIRIEEDFLSSVDKLSEEESLDRSSMLRKLLHLGFSDYMKHKVKEKYLAGKITLSEAAKMANLTLWEMQKYLVEGGYQSSYSIEDLEEDLCLLKQFKKKGK